MTRQDLARCLANPPRERSGLGVLNDRELELVSLLSQGNGSQQVSLEMGLNPIELTRLKQKVQRKMGFRDEVELIQFSAKQRVY